MAEEIKPEVGAQTVEELSKQVENLNKGIASYRDKAGTSEKAAADAKKEADTFKAEVDRLKKEAEKGSKGKEEETQLAPEDAKKLEAWAKSQGFVSKEELDQEKARTFNENLKNVESQAIDEFTKSHPEYDKDEEWDKIKQQFVLYKQPTSLTGYRQILAKIHKELKGSDDVAAKARAAEETRKRLGFGGGSQGGADVDKTLSDLREKYPNLSEEVIQARLEEINSLAKAREERNKARKK